MDIQVPSAGASSPAQIPGISAELSHIGKADEPISNRDVFQLIDDSLVPAPVAGDREEWDEPDEGDPTENADSTAGTRQEPPVQQNAALWITDVKKLTTRLVVLGRDLTKNGEKLRNVENALLRENAERGHPPLPKNDVLAIASQLWTRLQQKAKSDDASTRSQILTADEWLKRDFSVSTDNLVFGSTGNAIVRAGTKNLVEAPEKAFKTTTMMRLMMGLACGYTVFPALPVVRPHRALYLHGELNAPEIKERTAAAMQEIPEELLRNGLKNFFQGRDLDAHFTTKDGQNAIRKLLKTFAPEDVVFDPWQAFISGLDENTFQDISAAERFVDSVIQEFGVTVYIPIHVGKNLKKGARGHSSIGGWRDTLIKLKPAKGSKGELLVEVFPRWGVPPEPFRLTFKDGTMWPENAFTRQASRIRDVLRSHGGRMEKKLLKESLGMNDEAFRKAVQRAKGSKAIDEDGDFVSLPQEDEAEGEKGDAG